MAAHNTLTVTVGIRVPQPQPMVVLDYIDEYRYNGTKTGMKKTLPTIKNIYIETVQVLSTD